MEPYSMCSKQSDSRPAMHYDQKLQHDGSKHFQKLYTEAFYRLVTLRRLWKHKMMWDPWLLAYQTQRFIPEMRRTNRPKRFLKTKSCTPVNDGLARELCPNVSTNTASTIAIGFIPKHQYILLAELWQANLCMIKLWLSALSVYIDGWTKWTEDLPPTRIW